MNSVMPLLDFAASMVYLAGTSDPSGVFFLVASVGIGYMMGARSRRGDAHAGVEARSRHVLRAAWRGGVPPLPRLLLPSLDGQPRLTVVYFHGLGGSPGQVRQHVLPCIKKLRSPFIKVVSVGAPLRWEQRRYGWVSVASWFEYKTNHLMWEGEPECINVAQLKRSRCLVADIVKEEEALLCCGGKLLFVGYSQGSTIALDVAMEFPQRLAGVFMTRAIVQGEALVARAPQESMHAFPVAAFHGKQDHIVPIDAAEKSYDVLRRRGHRVDFVADKYADHTSVSRLEQEALAAFVQRTSPALAFA